MARQIRYPFYVKAVLVLIAFLLSSGTVVYTSLLVRKLEARQKLVAETWAAGLQHLASSDPETADLTFIFDEIVTSIDFPVIVSDSRNQPIPGFYRNIEFPEILPDSQQIFFLKNLIREYDRERDPILVTLNDTLILQKIHYGNSSLIEQLRWFPYIQIALVGLFILFGYMAFSIIRRQEQSSVWVGMSKETAHQLGTPLSGLLAWIEILKDQETSAEKLKTISDMEQDIQRLMVVTDRFSKIGAKPVLTTEELVPVLREMTAYLERRLLKTKNRQSDIELISTGSPRVRINAVLFGWVIENLIKNALDACFQVEPRLRIIVSDYPKQVILDISDNGRGLSRKLQKEIFRPGFTTKQRGWGMGLSLAKRIVEEYHGGKIYVLQSEEGKGTTFRIELPRVN